MLLLPLGLVFVGPMRRAELAEPRVARQSLAGGAGLEKAPVETGRQVGSGAFASGSVGASNMWFEQERWHVVKGERHVVRRGGVYLCIEHLRLVALLNLSGIAR